MMPAQHRSRTVCLLGGTGFVGRSVSNQLVRLGYSVRIPTRNRQRHRQLLVLPGVELRNANIHNDGVLARLIDDCDAVVNLVGILNEKGHDGSGFKAAHVDLAEKLVRACQDAGVSRLIQMSALKANADRGPSHYLRSKGQAEQIIRDFSGEEIKFTILRPSVIFGPDDTFTTRFAAILRRVPVLPMPQLNARFAPVYVEDVAAAVARTLHDSNTYGRTYELCGPQIYSLGEILQFILRQLGIKRLVVPLPLFLGRIQAWVADYLIPGKPFSLDNLRSLSVASVCNENGFSELGINPRPMQTIVPSYLSPGPTHLARLRETTGR
jgi:NADH dehydrogenase